MKLWFLVTLFISFPLYCTQNTYYIKPTADTPCPGEPCHTLYQYGEQYFHNFSSNSTLEFLPGNHTLNFTISVGTLSDSWDNQQPDPYYPPSSLSLLGSPSSLPEITSRIVCTWPAGFLFSEIAELHITALAFVSCGHNDSAAINILLVWNINISICTFQGNTNNQSGLSEYGFGGAIHVYGSNLTLIENIFQNNFAYQGGALEAFTNNTITLSRNIFYNNSANRGGGFYAHESNFLTLSENVFQSNSANQYGGALYAHIGNTLTLLENTFQSNSADRYGGALYANTGNTLTLSENTFQSNSADRYGGALYANTSNTLTLLENAFENNSAARYGGAVDANIGNTLTLLENMFQGNSAEYIGGAVLARINNILTISKNMLQDNSADYGGALYAYTNNTLTLLENTFQGNFADNVGGAIDTNIGNTITLSENTFQNNSADNGGCLYANINNTLTLSGNTLQDNSAEYGGALYAYINNTLTLSENTFKYNYADKDGGALNANMGSTIVLSENTFLNNSADYGGALYAYTNNTLTLSENAFRDNSANFLGGAVMAQTNNALTISENTFRDNSADYDGTVYAYANNTLTLSENTFQDNSADRYGGALSTNTGNTLTLSENTFQNNSAQYGGCLYVYTNNTLTLTQNTFQKSLADYGGALYAQSNNTFTLSGNMFHNNSALLGGALFPIEFNILTLSENTFYNNFASVGGAFFPHEYNILTLSGNTFQNNSADYSGGVLYAFTNNVLTLSDNMFLSNSAAFDGGVLVVRKSTVNLTNNILTGNTAESHGGAIFCLSNSTIQVLGSHRLQNNMAQHGGAVAALGCQIVLAGDVIFENNTADYGGGLYTIQSEVSGYAYFSENYARRSGGGIYASRSNFYFKQSLTFVGNSALNGGGLLLTDDSKFYLLPNATIMFTNNFVWKKGGAIKVERNNPLRYCVEASCNFLIGSDCFFQIQTERRYNFTTNITEIAELHNVRMHFQNNTALEAGATLYGGSVDDCSLTLINPQRIGDYQLYMCPNSGEVFDYITSFDERSQLDISSDPLYICSCEDKEPDCSVSAITRSVYPGGTIQVPILAYGERNGATPAVVHMITPGDEITIKETERTQNITKSCTLLYYTVQTHTEGSDYEMTLHIGPCPPEERTVSLGPTNVIAIHLSILQCPPGFKLSDYEPLCNCAQRLERYTNTCRIADQKIERTAEFWVGYVQDNTSDGLILHRHCPFDYCISSELYIAVNDSDKQCSNNRTGLLCGRCAQTFSLALGTNRCLQCSNDYLWLLVAFAFAGVALVLLLLVLRLTVAVGTINGLIFYTNIVAMNSAALFKPHVTNILTVFISWLNLDLGIETCFYDGMDAYTKTRLQFAFPFYVWALVGIIILASHYSTNIATIFGSNPTAVLATLFLLSYTKFLHTIIAALSYTVLEYPNNSRIAVWLYDANITYLSNKHVPLFATALVCLIVLFLPYTVFLIFSQWLRSKSGKCRIFSWVNNYRILPFLEAYHAPYTDKYRYWTGLMLLVRSTLFLVIAFNALGDPSINVLATGSITATLLILYALLGNRVYKTWYLNVLELSFIANICILALGTLYIRSTGGNQNAITFTSISVAFTVFIGIVTYHSVTQTKATLHLWKRIFKRRSSYELFPRKHSREDTAPPSLPDPSDGCATVTHIDFPELLAQNFSYNGYREPCLDDLDD